MLLTIKLHPVNSADGVYIIPKKIEAMWKSGEYETTILMSSGDTLLVREDPETVTKIVRKVEELYYKHNDTRA